MNEKPSVLLSAIAALLCLGALPFGVAIFAVGTTTPAEAWLEGGWPMYAVVALGLVASLVNAAGAFFVTRGSPWAAGVGVFLSIATVVVLTIAAGALLRAQRSALAAVVGALLVSVAGLGGVRALVHPNDLELAVLERPTVTMPLRAMDGTPVDRRDRALALTAKGLLGFDDAPVTNLAEAISRASSSAGLNLRLAPDVTAEHLVAALKELREQEVDSVSLLGQATIEPSLGFTPPRPFPHRLDLLTGVRVLLATDSMCETLKCEFGTLTERGLTVGDETLPLVKKSLVLGAPEMFIERHAIHLQVGAVPLEQLLDAAHTAAAKGRVLALHL